MKFLHKVPVLILCSLWVSTLPAQMRRILSPTPANWSFFGDAVSMYDKYAFIAEPVWHSGFGASEEAHFYRLEGINWKRTNTIKTTLSVSESFLGRRSGMSEHWLVFSQQNQNGSFKMHLHERVQDTFLYRQTLAAPEAFDDGSVAETIGISDEHLVFGGSGYLYFYHLNNGVWELNTTISKPGTELGHNADLYGNRAVACDITLDVAYVFEFNGTTWKEVAQLRPEAGQNHVFGENCAIYKDWIAIGDFVWQSNSELDTNKVYLYKWPPGSSAPPQFITKLKSPSQMRNPGFGTAIEFTDEYLFIGSILDDVSFNLARGRVHKYRRSGDQFEYLRAYGLGQSLGDCIAVWGNQVMFGEPGYNNNAGAVWVGPALDTLYLMDACALPSTINGQAVSGENFNDAFFSDSASLDLGAPRKFGMVMLQDFFQQTVKYQFCLDSPLVPAQKIDIFNNYTLLLPPGYEVEWSTTFTYDGQVYTAADVLDDVHALRPTLITQLPVQFELKLNYGKIAETPCHSWPVTVNIYQYYCPADTLDLTMFAGDTIWLTPGCTYNLDMNEGVFLWQSKEADFSFTDPFAWETGFFPLVDDRVWFMIFPPSNSTCPAVQRFFNIKVLQRPSATSQLDKASGIRVYPNPGADFLNLEYEPEAVPGPLTLISADGRIVREISAPNSINRLDVSDLPNGLYALFAGSGWIFKWVKTGP